MLALTLATIGVAIWGLVESIKLTQYTVSDFWDLVDNAQVRVEGTISALQSMEGASAKLTNASTVLAANPAGERRCRSARQVQRKAAGPGGRGGAGAGRATCRPAATKQTCLPARPLPQS